MLDLGSTLDARFFGLGSMLDARFLMVLEMPAVTLDNKKSLDKKLRGSNRISYSIFPAAGFKIWFLYNQMAESH